MTLLVLCSISAAGPPLLEPMLVFSGGFHEDLEAADLDGDGAIDVLVTDERASPVVRRGGEGTFVAAADRRGRWCRFSDLPSARSAGA